MQENKVSICIACHNQARFLSEAIRSCLKQTYANIEVIVLDDASTDNPRKLGEFTFPMVKYYRSDEPSGSGEAFNKAINYATGDFIVLLCADDLFTNKRVISDIVHQFKVFPKTVHVSRYYHQFVDGDKSPVRAWRNDNLMELANNPSGLAFRRSAIGNAKLSNKMFVEAPSFVSQVRKNTKDGWSIIIPWDTVAVRVHKSTARSKEYYRKMWNSSPVEEWAKLGWRTNDFTHLIQVKNYSTTKAVLNEIFAFIRINPFYIINPFFMFFSITALCTPRSILLYLPELYRSTFGRALTREMRRP